MTQSIRTEARRKPEKPSPDFPLFAHASGQWAKKINRRLVYFGVWSDPASALERMNFELPFLKKGETPPDPDSVRSPDAITTGCTLHELCNSFLASKEAKMESRELSPRTFRDYFDTCKILLGQFGRDRRVGDLGPTDFQAFRSKLSKRYNPGSLAGRINRCRVVLNHAKKIKKLYGKEIDYGGEFEKPSSKVLRRDRNQAGPKVFTRDEVLRILDVCNEQMQAMVLLAINAGFGNTDVATVPRRAINMKTGWIEFPRPKTEIQRRIPLWGKTIDALEAAHAVRPRPADPKDGGLCFLTKQGRPWVRIKTPPGKAEAPKMVPIDAISGEFAKILKKLEINGRRGIGFYTLSHCFETYAGESKDQVAVDSVMGHVDSSMAANYRHKISDERLVAVTNHMRQWLFADDEAG